MKKLLIILNTGIFSEAISRISCGTVFKVYDDQDSGNICFGTEKDGQRYFIKFAGAPTEQYNGNPADAIARLRATLPVYSELQHENLIKLVEAKDIGGGFAMMFKWATGDCMGRMYPAAHRRFMQLTIDARLTVFRDILNFFEYIVSQNYVAIDFYDGSIMYDFENGKRQSATLTSSVSNLVPTTWGVCGAVHFFRLLKNMSLAQS